MANALIFDTHAYIKKLMSVGVPEEQAEVHAEDSLCVVLADGREISVPLVWFARLQKANQEQKKNWRLIGGEVGIHWKDVDEDISVETLLSVRYEKPVLA